MIEKDIVIKDRLRSIMVVLRKIKRSDGFIETEYYPENGQEHGYMKLDLLTNKVVAHQETPRGSKMSAYHTKLALVRLAELEKLPEEKTILWY